MSSNARCNKLMIFFSVELGTMVTLISSYKFSLICTTDIDQLHAL